MSRMIVMCGLPGSGKSTLAQKEYPGFVRINQDELKSRDECAIKTKDCIKRGEDVLIDRVNWDKRQRQVWIKLAKYYGCTEIVCIRLNVPPDVCLKRVKERKDHPTIPLEMPLDKKSNIVYTFNRRFEEPEIDEGFDKILILNPDGSLYGTKLKPS